MGKITVSKLDTAERQLREAIVMHFEERDPIAIHTLACAASQVTADLMKAKGLSSMVRGGAMIREDKRKEVLRVMAAPENFFKHADRDPNEVIAFNPETTEFFIYAALLELVALKGALPKEGAIFQMWFLVKYDDMLLENEQTKVIREALERAKRNGLSPDDRAAFLDLIRN